MNQNGTLENISILIDSMINNIPIVIILCLCIIICLYDK